MPNFENKKYFIIVFVVISVLIIGFILALDSSPSNENKENGKKDNDYKDIPVSESRDLINTNNNDPDFIILDVRTPEEYNEGHIKNSTNIDFYSETFKSDLDKLDKEKTYLVYCRSGSRSASSSEIMIEKGFSDVYNMLGGIIRWKEAGYDTVQD